MLVVHYEKNKITEMQKISKNSFKKKNQADVNSK